jgi:hypothetical protein
VEVDEEEESESSPPALKELQPTPVVEELYRDVRGSSSSSASSPPARPKQRKE